MALNPRLNDPDLPLVSIIVLNYNQGKFLEECLDSIFAQSYDNIEICFSDNCSTDNSWEIAQEYQQRHPNIIFLARQRQDCLDNLRFDTAWINVRGYYFVEMNAGDATLHPEFVQTCIEALQANPDAGFVMVHRNTLSASGQRIDENPYYDQSCKIPGNALAAEFISSSIIGSTSQAMYRKVAALSKAIFVGRHPSHYYGTQYLNFQLCIEGPALFIKDALMTQHPHFLASLHPEADTLLQAFGPYLLNMWFFDLAKINGLREVTDRFTQTVAEIAAQALRLAVLTLLEGDERNAKRYCFQAAALNPEITDDAIFRQLYSFWELNTEGKNRLRSELLAQHQAIRPSPSRVPPPGSQPLI